MHRVSLTKYLVAAAAVMIVPAALAAQSFSTEKFNIGGDGGFDYLSVDAATGRVFVSRGTHIMVVDGNTGKVVGDIGDTPRTHGALLVPRDNHGFTTNGGDSTSTMFDLKTLAVIKKIHAGESGLDGFMYDDATDRAITIDHGRPNGTAVVINAKTGDVVGKIAFNGDAPEGGVADGKGRIFFNMEDKNEVEVVDDKTWKVVTSWSVAPCEGPTGIAMDRSSNRLFVGCSKTAMVLDASTGKVVATIPVGEGVDALGWDQSEKLMYVPAGGSGNVTVVHEDSPDSYRVVATVLTMRGARTLAVNDRTHTAYVFTPEYGPPPAGAPAAPAGGRGRGPRGPVIASWLIAIKH